MKRAIELLEDIRNNCWTTKYIMSSDSKNAEVLLNLIEKLQKENEELKKFHIQDNKHLDFIMQHSIPVQKVKAIIDRIDYDIKKTKEIISNNLNNYTSDRKNDYQIVRLRAMNTKSLDIKKRLQKLLEGEENVRSNDKI